ncbi:MAG: 3-hydroxy-9,10-secoandrosta-1,3,5(10)-triene-9,17-dione monooxygenase [Gammaproteobacteria bacterium]|jgi:3-hydroxy-9,10-secoandrosta-1,3,5(10)-triene-9,17-dione monooxygenase
MTVSAKELVGRAHELAPTLAARAAETEQHRAPLDESIDDLIDAGFLATLTPKVYGGHELAVSTMAAITACLSAACPSTGWVAAFYMGAAWRTIAFSERAQREAFAEKPYILCAGQAAPLREVIKVEGGYRISGQTAWSSGSVHAEWINFMGAVTDGDSPPYPMTFMVPRAQVEIIDTWFVSGMRGTGSNDVKADDVFVPEYRASSTSAALEGRAEGQAIHANPMYRQPFVPFLMCEVVPAVVGALRGAVDAFAQHTRVRQGTISGAKAATKQAAQMRLARGHASVDAAQTLLEAYLDRYTMVRPEQNELIDRADMKLKAAFITDLCRNAINDLARGFGGDGFRDHNPLQRYFRDINLLAVHAFLDIDNSAETYGRLMLGLPAEERLL